jgi:hypothetical protein
MNSQISNIIQDINLLIKDPQYKANFESLVQNYNNSNNNTPINTPTTERDIEIKRITDDIITNIGLRVADIKQQAR